MVGWGTRLAVALALGCGAPVPPATDAGVDAAQDLLRIDAGELAPLELAPPALPAEPELPAEPVLGPCATGWVERDGLCLPAIDDAPTCAEGEHAFATGCRRVGSPCPADGWPADLPMDRAVSYVAPSGRIGADGTRADPFATLEIALSRTHPRGVIALSAGTHAVFNASVDREVEVRGACPEQTRIESTSPLPDAVLVGLNGSGAIRDVTLSSRGVPVTSTLAGSDVRITGVIIDGGRGAGVLSTGSGVRVALDDVVIRGITALPAWGDSSTGILAGSGGEVDARAVLIEDLEGSGVALFGGARLTGTNLTIRNVRARAVEPSAPCVAVAGSSAHLSDSLLELCPTAGVSAGETDAVIDLEGVLVRDTAGQDDGHGGQGVRVYGGASLSIRRSVLLRNRTAGVSLEDASAALTDVVIADTLPERATGGGGYGVSSGYESAAVLSRVRVERARTAGVATLWRAGARLDVTDLVVRSPRRAPGGDIGAGVFCDTDTSCALARVLVEDAEGRGMNLAGEVTGSDLTILGVRPVPHGGPGSGMEVGGTGVSRLERVRIERASSEAIKVWGGGHAILADVIVREPLPDRFLFWGTGIWVTAGSTLELTRALIEDARFAGVFVDGVHPDEPGVYARATLVDLTVRRVHGDELIGFFGNAVRTTTGTVTTITRARFEEARETALVALGTGAEITGEDVEILSTAMRACTERDEEPCATDVGGGCGITAFDHGGVTLRRFRSNDNALCGVMIAPSARIVLVDGEIARNPIGANVQVAEYDLGRLSDGVRYVDNDRNYDGATLPVPDDAPPSF